MRSVDAAGSANGAGLEAHRAPLVRVALAMGETIVASARSARHASRGQA